MKSMGILALKNGEFVPASGNSRKMFFVGTGNASELPIKKTSPWKGIKKSFSGAVKKAVVRIRIKDKKMDFCTYCSDSIDIFCHLQSEKESSIEIGPVTAEQQLINDIVRMYTEDVVGKYKGNKNVELKKDISSINELCTELNDQVNKVNDRNKSKFLPLFKAFTKKIEGKIPDDSSVNYLGRMSDFPEHLYLQEKTEQMEEVKQINENQRLLADFLKDYINNNERHLKCFKDILKKEEIKKYAVIELENKTNVVFRVFPKNNREIAELLTILSKNHRADGTWAKDLAKFLEKSELAAFMKIEPLENNAQLQLVFLEDNLTSVNDNIKQLTLLTQFIGNKIPHIKNALANLNKPNPNDDPNELQNAQRAYYRMTQIFSDEDTKDYLKEGGLGNKDNTIKNTVDTRQILDNALKDIEQASNSKFSFKKEKHSKVKTRLENIRTIANNWETLKRSIASNNTVKNIDNRLRDAIAEDIKQLDRELISISLHKFTKKIKSVLIGIGVVTLPLVILAPYLTIPLLITSIVLGLIYLMTEYKPMTVESDINKVLSASVKKLSNKKTDAKFESQAVPWSTAFRFWLTGTLPIAKKEKRQNFSLITEKLTTFIGR
ncbi:hypothetical protein [Candidatus Regiella insecticola]|uniref:Uncharacterized protein n=1 Tax=Candidatus Regiella insecticola TaxID=138073 RepID=A0A6L2ZM39_9ENTR|nr:hypothetical protein [Candidatus Regiella insecticola]GFN45430.1 hypothetical protein RINTU1_05970 [Candidatus Regiella insecticola]GFN46681.1 hypothetical protein RINTU1_24000 [Candidatus Regiella insecticola]